MFLRRTNRIIVSDSSFNISPTKYIVKDSDEISQLLQLLLASNSSYPDTSPDIKIAEKSDYT